MSSNETSTTERPTVPLAVHGGWIVALLLLGIAVRGANLVLTEKAFNSDRDNYRQLAENLFEHRTLGSGDRPTAYRPPLYPLCLAGAFAALPPLQAAAALHLALGTLTIVGVYFVSRSLEDRLSGALAALLVAYDPLLLHQSTLFMTETLATFLSVLTLLGLTWVARRRSAVAAFSTGLALGLGALCRPTFLVWFLLIVVVGLAWPTLLAGRRNAAWLAIAAATCLVPWTVRNQLVFGTPVLTTTHGGYTLLLANNPEFYTFVRTAPFGSVWTSEKLDAELLATLPKVSKPADELANDRRCRELAWGHIRRDPAGFGRACAIRVGYFWSLLPHTMSRDEPLTTRALRYSIAGFYAIEFGLALVGLWSLGRRIGNPTWVALLLAVVAFTAVHAVYWSNLRMRAPIAPWIACAAAAGILECWRRTALRNRLERPDLGPSDSGRSHLDPAGYASL